MIASGGTAKEAAKLADAFQELLHRRRPRTARGQERERHHQGAGAADSKPKEPANLPNEFKTNDDFCPGCGLELRSMTTERTALWGDVFQREPRSGRCAGQAGAAGAAAVHGLGTRTAARRRSPGADRRPAQGHRGDGEGAAGQVRLRARRARRRERRSTLQVHLRGNPMRLGRSGAARLPHGAEPGERDDVLQGQRPPRARAHDRGAADCDARHRQSRSGRSTSAPAWSTRRATSASTASGRVIPSCSITSRSTSSTTACRSRRCIARSCGARSIS